jgi:hypothetical protein
MDQHALLSSFLLASFIALGLLALTAQYKIIAVRTMIIVLQLMGEL